MSGFDDCFARVASVGIVGRAAVVSRGEHERCADESLTERFAKPAPRAGT
jgi:hypothetical protein